MIDPAVRRYRIGVWNTATNHADAWVTLSYTAEDALCAARLRAFGFKFGPEGKCVYDMVSVRPYDGELSCEEIAKLGWWAICS